MRYLLDTNIFSEARKGKNAHPNVRAWFESIDSESLYLSALVIGEVRKGLEQARRKDPLFGTQLESWLNAAARTFDAKILPIDQPIAEEWGRMDAIRSVPVIDGLIAATAKVHQMTLVTRNVVDMEGLGVEVLNPFEFPI